VQSAERKKQAEAKAKAKKRKEFIKYFKERDKAGA
jgi:hypothetical protein